PAKHPWKTQPPTMHQPQNPSALAGAFFNCRSRFPIIMTSFNLPIPTFDGKIIPQKETAGEIKITGELHVWAKGG
ncbi:MAG TPA: hypothetical protein PLW42_10505, partial [Anaerohalosphaeraceae bacterium]|nr:hypothetical protein [Anaerohalosphaeraceae bacterium]